MIKRPSLGLEELGARLLPSATPLLGPGSSIPTAQSSSLPAVSPQITVAAGQGQYTNDQVHPDAGTTYHLTGTASFGAFGRFTVSGTVNSVGMIAQGQAGGSITFTNQNGSFTMHLQGPKQPAFSPLPGQFSYTITGGAGAYQHLTDKGSLALAVEPQLSEAPPPAGQAPHGDFQFVLKSSQGVHPAPAATGITGQALVGPVTPVAQPWMPNTEPLAGAIITIHPAKGGPEITRVLADSEGRFVVELPPGTYQLVGLPPKPGESLPRGIPVTVTVPATGLASVVVNYDSGIR